MRSSWKAFAAIAAGLLVAPQLAAADDVQDQLKKMQERMSQLEDRLQSTTDQLDVTTQRASEQQQMLERAGVAEAKGSKSGLDSFFDTLEFGGYVDATYNYNINHVDAGNNFANTGLPGSGFTALQGANGLYSFMGNANSFDLQALKFEMERPVSVENRGGFRADIFFGETARVLNSLGTGTVAVVNTSNNTGAPAIVIDSKSDSQVHVSQAYAQYLAPLGDIKVKAGKFYTLLGAEVTESPYNYNITRSILYFNLPIEHMGVLAEKTYDNGLTWALGAVNGWDRDNGADFNKSKSLMGRFGWLGDSYGALANLIYGAEQAQNESNKRGVFDLVFTANPIEKLSMYLNFDLGWQDFAGSSTGYGQVSPGVAALNQKTTFWWGVAMAGRYAITDRLGFSLRGEYFQDDRSGFFCTQGATYPGNSAFANCGNSVALLAPANLRSTAYEATATLDYALTSNLTARAEFRADWVNNQNVSDRFFRSSSDRALVGGLPGLQSNQQTVAAQLYYRF